VTTRYEIVRNWTSFVGNVISVQRHKEQPPEGFAYATEASLWCDAHPRCLDGSWYIRAVEASNG
jgi:hypothetical protein